MTERVTSDDPRPSWLISAQAPGSQIERLEVDGQPYAYTIIKAGLAPGLPFAVGYPSDEALMISEDSPEDYRRFILSHEVREKNRFADLPESERCRAALQAELSDVQEESPEGYTGYLIDRAGFFDALIELYKQPAQAAAVTPGFIEGIQASRDYLLSVVPPIEAVLRVE